MAEQLSPLQHPEAGWSLITLNDSGQIMEQLVFEDHLPALPDDDDFTRLHTVAIDWASTRDAYVDHVSAGRFSHPRAFSHNTLTEALRALRASLFQ